MSQSAEVIQFNKNEIAAFSEFRSQLATLKHDNSKAVFNYADPKGNKEARSHIYKLRQTKSAVDKVRKEQKQEKHKAEINNAAVDALVAGGIDAKIAKQVITLIAKGTVKNVTIRY